MDGLNPCPLCGGEAKQLSSFHQREDGLITSCPAYECCKCGEIFAGTSERDFYDLKNGRGGFATKDEIDALDNLARERWNEKSRMIDRESLLSVCAEIDDADVDGCVDWADRIRRAIGEDAS